MGFIMPNIIIRRMRGMMAVISDVQSSVWPGAYGAGY